MRKLLIILLFVNVSFSFCLAQQTSYIKVKIDGAEESYRVENAFLHDSTTIMPDTTVQVSTASMYTNFLYPKIVPGNKQVMRLILTRKNRSIDFLLELDDQLSKTVILNDKNSRIFMNPGFRLQIIQQKINNVSGKLEFLGMNGSSIRKAKIDLNFNRTIGSETKQIAMKGNFKPMFSELNNENIFTEIAKSKGENKNLRHLELAGILVSIFLVFLFTK